MLREPPRAGGGPAPAHPRNSGSDLPKLTWDEEIRARMAERTGGRYVPVRRSFFYRESESDPLPPALWVWRGASPKGKAADLRPRLLATFLWVAGGNVNFQGRAFTVEDVPDDTWATLLGLNRAPDDDEPDLVAGARRIADARRWLKTPLTIGRRKKLGPFIGVEAVGGRPPRITLRREDGSGRPYTHPGQYYITAKGRPGDIVRVATEEERTRRKAPKGHELVLPEGNYVRLPTSLWADGTIGKLTGASFMVLLALLLERDLDDYRQKRSGRPLHGYTWAFTPEERHVRFGLSPSAWSRGKRRLEDLRLAEFGSLRRLQRHYEHAFRLEACRLDKRFARPGDK